MFTKQACSARRRTSNQKMPTRAVATAGDVYFILTQQAKSCVSRIRSSSMTRWQIGFNHFLASGPQSVILIIDSQAHPRIPTPLGSSQEHPPSYSSSATVTSVSQATGLTVLTPQSDSLTLPDTGMTAMCGLPRFVYCFSLNRPIFGALVSFLSRA